MESNVPRHLQERLSTTKVLVVDDDPYMRKVVRAMLMSLGVKTIIEAADGITGLDTIREHSPDIVLLDWEMPMLDGPAFVSLVRTPGEFPAPDVPIIMLTGHGDRWRVVEAARVGVHEYLLKPVSTKALLDRIVSVLMTPRRIVQFNGYYGPAPRKLVVVNDEVEKPTQTPKARSKDVVML